MLSIKRRSLRTVFVTLFALCTSVYFNTAIAQAKPAATDVIIKGKVISDKDNQPLLGVSVSVPDAKKIVTVTDDKGMYQIKVPKNSKSLLFSYVGFVSKEVIIANKTQINVTLSVATSDLDEVVVVGYGEQKKINQTGSTQTVKFDESVNTPVTNASQLMYGKFAGVQLTQGSGLPGSDGSTIVIRGVGSFTGTNPLVVIDNIQYDDLVAFNSLSPSDIESVSVLKDASSTAIYGAKGANGVIVVTTKTGKSGPNNGSILYNNYYGTQAVTVTPEFLNSINYATIKNEYYYNKYGPTTTPRFSAAALQAITDGSDPDRYANTNWVKEILRQAPIQNHSVSFSGGNDKTTYRVSLGYLAQDAVVRGKFKTKRYTISANLDSKLNGWLSINNVLNGSWNNFTGPQNGGSAINAGDNGIMVQFQRSPPTVPVYYSNGYYGFIDGTYDVSGNGAIANARLNGEKGDYVSKTISLSDRFAVKFKLNQNLSFETSGSIILGTNLVSNYQPLIINYDYNGNSSRFPQGLAYNTLTNSSYLNYRMLNENILRYTNKFKKNELTVLLGHSVSYANNSNYSATISNFINDAIQQLDGAIGLPSNTGRAEEEARQSFFTRINYSNSGKYLFELNLRRDGSSRFGASNVYGNFPSASVGWRVSQEQFFRNKFKWISNMKLRASWGITGNDNIRNYVPYQTYNTANAYNIGGAVVTGVAINSLANPRVQWEEVQQTNIGVDMAFLRNRLTFTADYFVKNSSKVLYKNLPVPASIGVTNLAAENAADMLNSGLELALNYQGRIKKLNYTIGVSGSFFNENKVTGLGNRGLETVSGTSIIRIGAPFNAYYGFNAIGIFQNAAEVASAPVQFGSPLTAPGDIRYADISGPNGKPDGVIDDNDLSVIGTPYPKMTYNINGSLNYKGFDLSLTSHGLSGINRFLNGNGQGPMNDDVTNALSYWINRWTPTNPSTTLPRVGGINNTKISTFYLQDASYLRLKNIEIGYSIPPAKTKKFLISKFRIFVSAQNILTFTKMENYDPERLNATGSDQLVPLYKVYTMGLNLKF